MISFKEFVSEKGPGLWANIHKRRKSGKRMRKKGEKGAPTAAAMKSASEASDFKLTPAREKELEKLAKDLPDADFKKKYGKDWKSVKIATAMNMLKKKHGFKEGKTDMTAISSWKKKLKDVKGLTKQQVQMLSTLPTPVITSLINQVGMIVADMSEGKRTDGATSFMFKNGPDSKKFLAYAKDFRKAERWTMNGLFFVDVYDVNKPVAIKLAKFHQQFWKEDVNEGMNMKQIMRKHGRELKKAVRTGNLELSDKAEEDLQQWVFDNEPYVGDDPDDFDQWLDDNIEDIVKGRIK